LRAEALFRDAMMYGIMLSRERAKPKYSAGRMVRILRPNEVLARLKNLGANISQQTLRRYEAWGIIDEPQRCHGGKGHGNITDYDPVVIEEAYAAYMMLNADIMLDHYTRIKANPEGKTPGVPVSLIRETAAAMAGGVSFEQFSADKSIPRMVKSLAECWLWLQAYVKYRPPDRCGLVIYVLGENGDNIAAIGDIRRDHRIKDQFSKHYVVTIQNDEWELKKE